MIGRAGCILAAAAFAALAASGAGIGASNATYQLSANMNARQVFVPREPRGDVARARGAFSAKLSVSRGSRRLVWRISYSNLASPNVVIADIHYGKPGKFGPILVRLCGPCRSGQRGVKRVRTSGVRAILGGRAFITLITNRNPNGEIRGQIAVRK